MKTLSAAEAVKKVEESIPNPEVRDGSLLKVGQGARQGDLYLARVKRMPKSKRVSDRQLVQGNTQGSRHVITGDATVFEPDSKLMPKWVNADALLSPAIVVGESGAVLEHPEHAHIQLPPKSIWVTWQQMDARTRNRTQD